MVRHPTYTTLRKFASSDGKGKDKGKGKAKDDEHQSTTGPIIDEVALTVTVKRQSLAVKRSAVQCSTAIQGCLNFIVIACVS